VAAGFCSSQMKFCRVLQSSDLRPKLVSPVHAPADGFGCEGLHLRKSAAIPPSHSNEFVPILFRDVITEKLDIPAQNHKL
jgi:hypothetical protein